MHYILFINNWCSSNRKFKWSYLFVDFIVQRIQFTIATFYFFFYENWLRKSKHWIKQTNQQYMNRIVIFLAGRVINFFRQILSRTKTLIKYSSLHALMRAYFRYGGYAISQGSRKIISSLHKQENMVYSIRIIW